MEQSIKTNRLIAEFMGYEIISYNGSEKLIYNGNRFAKTLGEQKKLWNGLDIEFTGRFVDGVKYPFDTDFNYLIPVIRKIEEQGYVVAIRGISYQIYKVMDEGNPIVSLVCGDLSKKTEMTCDLIVSFIEKKTIIERISSIIEKNGSFTTAYVMAMQSPVINSIGKSTFVLAETFHKHSCEGVVYVHDHEESSDDYDYEDLSEDVLYEILSLAEEWDAKCYKTEKRISLYKKRKAMTTEQAKQVLREAGYYVDNLWHINDVMDRFECNQEEAQEVLNGALTNGHVMETIHYSIEAYSSDYYNRKGGEQ